jgi:uncharacterized protein (DUF302 family)
MSYYISKTVGRPFDMVVEEITARLKDHGFGILTDIDVQATLKKKIGADVAKYRILGSMERTGNPALRPAAEEVRRHLSKALEELGSS